MRMRTNVLFIFAATLALVVSGVSAWTGPTQTPPNGNVAAPMNVGSAYQEKTGSAWFDGGIGVNAGSSICIGASCITTWPNSSQWTTNGTSIYYGGGNVGINTTSPAYPLTVSGSGAAMFGATPEIFANGDNHTGGGIAVSGDGGFFDYNDGYITFNGASGLKIAGGSGATTTNDVVMHGGNLTVNSSWSSDSVNTNGNQVWNGVNGDGLYLQYSNSNGPVVVGGQSGYTNNLDVYGQVYTRGGIIFNDGTVQTTAAKPQTCSQTCGSTVTSTYAVGASAACSAGTHVTGGGGTCSYGLIGSSIMSGNGWAITCEWVDSIYTVQGYACAVCCTN